MDTPTVIGKIIRNPEFQTSKPILGIIQSSENGKDPLFGPKGQRNAVQLGADGDLICEFIFSPSL